MGLEKIVTLTKLAEWTFRRLRLTNHDDQKTINGYRNCNLPLTGCNSKCTPRAAASCCTKQQTALVQLYFESLDAVRSQNAACEAVPDNLVTNDKDHTGAGSCDGKLLREAESDRR